MSRWVSSHAPGVSCAPRCGFVGAVSCVSVHGVRCGLEDIDDTSRLKENTFHTTQKRILFLVERPWPSALGVGQASVLPWRSRNSRCPQTPMAVGSFVRRLYVPSRRVIFEVRALRKGVWILSPALVCPRRRRCFRTHARARSHLAQMAKRLLKSWATSPAQLVTGQARREHRTLHELPRPAHSPSGR